jgi:hypothetical protein
MIGLLVDQRRAQRLPIYLPVQVYGKLDGVPFSENTETINVSACGGLVPISAAVVRAQKLILTNLQTDQDLTCRVARLIRSERGQVLAGLEFLHSAPGFWRSSPFAIDLAQSMPGKILPKLPLVAPLFISAICSPTIETSGCRLACRLAVHFSNTENEVTE